MPADPQILSMPEEVSCRSSYYGPTPEWVIALRYRSPEDYGVPTAPTIGVDEGEGATVDLQVDGETVIRAEEPMKVRP